MQVGRWLVGLAALLIAGAALYVLIVADPTGDSSKEVASGARSPVPSDRPAMDEIDAESRAAMRELLRQESQRGSRAE